MRVYLVAGIHPTIPAASGIRSYVLGLATALAGRGHDVTLVGAGPPADVPFGRFQPVTDRTPLSAYEFLRALVRWTRDHPLEEGSVVSAHRPDDLYPFLRRSRGVRWICTLHGDPGRGVASRRPLGKHLYRFVERRALRSAHRIISVSETGLAAYSRRYPEIVGKSCVIPVGIDLDHFRPQDRALARRSLDVAEGPTLLYAGRLEPEKNVDVLLEAVAGLRSPPQVLLAGQGSLEPRLRAQASGLPVRFLGRVPHADMPALLSCADGLVLASAFEGLPTSALEALACGTPVICTRAGDLPILVGDGRTGLFFDGTSEGLRAILADKLENLGAMRSACVEAASRFGWTPIAERILEVYSAAA